MKRLVLFITMVGAWVAWTGAAQAADGRIQEILDRGVLKACHGEVIPWSFKDPRTGEWAGTDVDAAKHLAKTMNVDIEQVDIAWSTMIPSLETNRCDIIMGPLFRTPERALRLMFSDPYDFETTGVAVRDDSGIATYADLDREDRVVAVLSGTADEAFANRFFQNADVRVLVTDKYSTVYLEVVSKRADAIITDTRNIKNFITANPDMNLRMLDEEPLNPQGISYGILPGEYHFRDFVNVWLEYVELNGLREQWKAKYSDVEAKE